MRHAKTILALLTAIFLAGVPLVYDTRLFLVFDLPKYALWMIGVALLVLAYLALLAIQKPRPIIWNTTQKTVLLLSLAVLVTQMLACVFAYNPHQSWWGNYYRRQGLFLFLHHLLLFLLVFDLARTPKLRHILLVGIGLGGVLVAAVGWLEIYGIPQFSHWKNTGSYVGRLLSTFGQPDLAAYYLGMTLPFIVLLFAKLRRWWKTLALLPATAMVIILFGTASRGALLALVTTLVLVAATALVLFPLALRKKVLLLCATSLGAVLILGAGAFALLRNPDTAWRVHQIVDVANWGKIERFQIWNKSLELFWHSPAWGYGMDNLELVFPAFLTPQDGTLHPLYIDRAHNIYLENLLGSGLFGTLALALLTLGACRKALQLIKQRSPQTNVLLALLAAVVFFGFNGLFNLSGILTDGLFFVLLALLWGVVAGEDRSTGTTIGIPPTVFRLLAIVLFVIATAWGSFAMFRAAASFQADLAYKNALRWELVGRQESLPYYRAAIALAPEMELYRLKAFDHLLQLGYAADDPVMKQAYYREGSALLQTGSSRGRSADWCYRMGQLYEYAREDLAQNWQAEANFYYALAHLRAPFKFSTREL